MKLGWPALFENCRGGSNILETAAVKTPIYVLYYFSFSHVPCTYVRFEVHSVAAEKYWFNYCDDVEPPLTPPNPPKRGYSSRRCHDFHDRHRMTDGSDSPFVSVPFDRMVPPIRFDHASPTTTRTTLFNISGKCRSRPIAAVRKLSRKP